MNKIFIRIKNLLINLIIFCLNIVIRRDNSIVLIGGWMGEKFSDNSRYLFQYLHYNREEAGISRVIWVTRNKEVYSMLKNKGYEVYLCGTILSFYWHIKSGMHILCNAIYVLQDGKFNPDLQTNLSFGARRIQLWHGIAIKSVGTASNLSKKNIEKSTPNNKVSKLNYWTSLGGWADYCLLSTSDKNKIDNHKISRHPLDSIIISSYPRNCNCLQLMDHEVDVIAKLNEYKLKVIYLPTFRSDYSEYIHPLQDASVTDFLKKNNILWVEKQHLASNFSIGNLSQSIPIYYLPENFDVNTLYQHVDAVISDYSSAVFDTIYQNVPVIMYTPDINVFKNGDVGLLFNLEDYCSTLLSNNTKDLVSMLREIRDKDFFSKERQNNYKLIMKIFFENREANYIEIWKSFIDFFEKSSSKGNL
ncbi:TPA: CDP-glycerol glycerophosphotransferase family protein [Streptococcus suis]